MVSGTSSRAVRESSQAIAFAHRTAKYFLENSAAIYSVANSFLQGCSLIATAGIVSRFLSAAEQGYYFSFLAVSSFQVIVELGFSQCVVQFSSNEAAYLNRREGGVLHGPAQKLARYLSIGRLAVQWYGYGSLLTAIILGGIGAFFFSSSKDPAVAWRAPWTAMCLASALNIALSPYMALIEGSGDVSWVYRYRLLGNLARLCTLLAAFYSGLKLFSPALSAVGSSVVLLIGFFSEKSGLLSQLHRYKGDSLISWSQEILPYQWRIAVSWIAGYFLFTALTPLVFHQLGSSEAGRFGLSWTVAQGILTLAVGVSATKLARYGSLIELGLLSRLEQEWRRTSTITLMIGSAGALIYVTLRAVLAILAPQLSSRLLSSTEVALLGIGVLLNLIIFCQAYFMRSFKKDPLMLLSVASALALLILASALAKPFGTLGICVALVGVYAAELILSSIIFTRFRIQLSA